LREQIAGLQYERRKDAVVMRMAPRLQSSAEKLRQHLLGRSHGRAAGRSGAMPGQSSTGELIAALEKELQMMGKSPKAMIMMGRAKASVDALELARREGAEREDELLQLLVENLAPINEAGGLAVGGGGPGASPPSMRSSVGNAILVPSDGRPAGIPRVGVTVTVGFDMGITYPPTFAHAHACVQMAGAFDHSLVVSCVGIVVVNSRLNPSPSPSPSCTQSPCIHSPPHPSLSPH